MEIFKLVGSVMVDTADAQKSIQKTSDEAEGLGQKLLGGASTAAKWATGVVAGATAVGGAMVSAAKSTAEDMDAIEFNEAFAVIDVLFQREHPHFIDRYNMLGGALAYGHPYGASGGILMLHLLKALEK